MEKVDLPRIKAPKLVDLCGNKLSNICIDLRHVTKKKQKLNTNITPDIYWVYLHPKEAEARIN